MGPMSKMNLSIEYGQLLGETACRKRHRSLWILHHKSKHGPVDHQSRLRQHRHRRYEEKVLELEYLRRTKRLLLFCEETGDSREALLRRLELRLLWVTMSSTPLLSLYT